MENGRATSRTASKQYDLNHCDTINKGIKIPHLGHQRAQRNIVSISLGVAILWIEKIAS
jgi:hypothetical protein